VLKCAVAEPVPTPFEHIVPGTVLLFLRKTEDIIGAEVLNGRVRDGIGCCHFARDTGNYMFKQKVLE
jgi:hypothetical protein